MKSPEVLAGLKAAGAELAPGRDPEALIKRIQEDLNRYGNLIMATGIKIE